MEEEVDKEGRKGKIRGQELKMKKRRRNSNIEDDPELLGGGGRKRKKLKYATIEEEWGDTDLELVEEEEQKIAIAPARICGPSIPAPRSNLHSVIADYFPKTRRIESPS